MRKRITITVETEETNEMELTFGLMHKLSETINIQKLEITMKDVVVKKRWFDRWFRRKG